MTFKIALSQAKALPFDFEAAVAAFIKAKQDHRQSVGEPAPNAPHRWVEAAVKRVPGSIEAQTPDEFVPDYEIVDDTPPPPSLDQRKMMLAVNAQREAQSAIEKLRPPLKARLLSIEFGRAMAIEEAKRTPADKATIAAYLDGNVRIEAITYHLAKIEAQIHDLTDATIDDFTPAAFPR
jgi:hypothetical protein